MNAHEGHSNHGSAHGDHERTDWRVSLVVWSVVSFFVLMFAAMLAMGWLFNTLGHAQGDVEPLSPLSEMRIEPPLPRLQVSPTDDLTQMQKDWQTELDSYGYVNKEAGIVRIPINHAMQLTVERGLPAREDAP